LVLGRGTSEGITRKAVDKKVDSTKQEEGKGRCKKSLSKKGICEKTADTKLDQLSKREEKAVEGKNGRHHLNLERGPKEVLKGGRAGENIMRTANSLLK